MHLDSYNKQLIGLLLALSFLIQPLVAQVMVSNGNHALEITGAVSTFYNHRFLTDVPGNRIGNNANEPFDKRKSRFNLRDAQIQLEGRVGHDWEYELQVDFADLPNFADIGENPGILDANVTYKGLGFVNATFGFQKLPYSRTSLVPFFYSPYWQRSELTRGEVFSRRDVGLTLFKDFWSQRINVYAGMYTGMGEQILSMYGTDNDPSGTFEYLGRIDIAYPARYRYGDYDINHVPIPMFALGLNARTVYRQFSSFLPGDDYYLRVISGNRDLVGIDATAQFMGFSAQFEWHQATIKPTNRIDPRTANNRYRENRGTKDFKIGSRPTGYFRAGGIVAQMSYYAKPLKSLFSVRYDNLNPNDLITDNLEECVTFAYAYLINGFNATFKAQYNHRVVNRKNPRIQRIDDQLRVGLQFMFR